MPKNSQQGLKSIERNAKQQIQLINDLLDISRIIRGQISLNLDVVNPVEPIINAIETVHFAAAAKGIQISTELDESVGPVPRRHRQAPAGYLEPVVKCD